MPTPAYAYDFEEEFEIAESESLATAAERERLALIEEVRRSEEHYARTGLHVTWEEVKAWLATWGTENEMEPPECHT